MNAEFVVLAQTSDVPQGEVRVFPHGDRSVALCNIEGKFYAVENVCTHDDAPLGEGRLDGHCIECPRHGARFDVRTGEVRQMPAVHPIPSFEIRVEGDNILMKVENE